MLSIKKDNYKKKKKKKKKKKNPYLGLIRPFKKGCNWLICSNVGLFD